MDTSNFMELRYIKKEDKLYIQLSLQIITVEYALEKDSNRFNNFHQKFNLNKPIKRYSSLCLCFLKIYMEDTII